MLKNVKLNDKLWSSTLGWGTVIEIINDFYTIHNIKIEIDSCFYYFDYTGCQKENKLPNLFWNELNITNSKEKHIEYKVIYKNIYNDLKISLCTYKDKEDFMKYEKKLEFVQLLTNYPIEVDNK